MEVELTSFVEVESFLQSVLGQVFLHRYRSGNSNLGAVSSFRSVSLAGQSKPLGGGPRLPRYAGSSTRP